MNNPKQNRGRHRNNARRSNPSRQNFDSNGPGVRVRGNATQIYEKYIQLARDAQSAGDRVTAENMLQHAEHYYRVLNENNPDRGRDQQRQNDGAGDQRGEASVEDDNAQAARGNEADQDGDGTRDADQGDDRGGDRDERSGDDRGGERGNGRGRRPRNAGGRAPRRRNGRGEGDGGSESGEAGGAEVQVDSAAQSELPINAD